MSDLKNHILFSLGLLVTVIVLNFQYTWIKFIAEDTFGMNPYAIFLLIGLFFTLLPDLDSETSLPHRYFTIGGLIGAIYFILVNRKEVSLLILLALLAIKSISSVGQFHRQAFWLHRKTFILVVLIIIFITFSPLIAIAAGIGLGSHATLDAISTTWRNLS